MDRYASLFEIAKLLLSEDDPDRIAETIFRRLLELTSSDRGFIVVREDTSFEVKFDVRFERADVSAEERRFSRRLVREVIESRKLLLSQDVLTDKRLSTYESVEYGGARSVLVVPLNQSDQVYGVVYLEQMAARGGFVEDSIRFVSDFAELAGMFLRRAVERDELRRRSSSLEHDLLHQYDFQGIVTHDDRMLALLKVVAQVAESDATVLVQGETGTGKELVARAVHVNSRRARRPFVALHCTALPATILESELFGHVRGAFTGADRERTGRIAAAHGGTLFLDEVAEIPPELQAKLLRFLQFGEIQRLGSDRVEKVDVRVVAATHRDLKAMVEESKFRQDLYYRLKVVELRLPPLRERRSDLPILIDAFLREPARGSIDRAYFSADAMALLLRHDWPGNVRELKHVVERARVLATGPTLGVDLLPPDLAGEPASLTSPAPTSPPVETSGEEAVSNAELETVRKGAVAAAEREFLVGLLERCGGNISQASRESGIHRSYLQRLMSKHGLRQA